MRRLLTTILAVAALSAAAKTNIEFTDGKIALTLNGNRVVTAPKEGLWSVATGGQNDWMC